MTKTLTLFTRTSLTVATGFLICQLVTGVAIFIYLLFPLAQRSADDLADLITLSARVWSQLPAENRRTFEVELMEMHGLSLKERPAAIPSDWKGFSPYLTFLETALNDHLAPNHQARVRENAGEQFQVEFTQAGHPLHFEFAQSKVTPRPSKALVSGLLAAVLASLLLAWLLVRRVISPVKKLSEAARKIAVAEDPPRLPESGEREFAELARLFNQMSQQLLARRENQSTLLAGVSHDLRSPLARMKMSVGMLATQYSSPLLTRIERDIIEMDRLIGAQLELARAHEREAREPMYIGSLLDELYESTEAQAPGRVKLRVRKLNDQYLIAPLSLCRILGNFLDNALRYAGDGTIELVLRRLKGSVFIGVRDRGPGIPPHLHEIVFRPFYRVDSSRNRSSGGSGLGLAIARQLAETQGWRLGYRSRCGGGTCAWLSIPAQRAVVEGSITPA